MTDIGKLIEKIKEDDSTLPFSKEEIRDLRNVLVALRAWHMVGKMALWFMITVGALATAFGAIKGQGWFGGP